MIENLNFLVLFYNTGTRRYSLFNPKTKKSTALQYNSGRSIELLTERRAIEFSNKEELTNLKREAVSEYFEARVNQRHLI